MFNLVANAMFEATRVTAPPVRPVRNRWFTNRAEDLALLPGRPSEPPRTVLAAGVGASRGTMP